MLRIATTFLMVLGLILSGGFIFVLQARPHHGERVALERYSLLLGGYLIITIFCFIGAAVCAIFLVRQVREAFQAESRQNLDILVETALHAHLKKPGANE